MWAMSPACNFINSCNCLCLAYIRVLRMLLRSSGVTDINTVNQIKKEKGG